MNHYQQNEKDISKIFTCLRARLQAKEKELLELQRSDPCLLVPDSDQIDTLLDAIASLQLSTQDGSFVFASTSDSDEITSFSSASSTDFNSIKTLPSVVWLSQSKSIEQQQRQQPSIFNHLLILPIHAYLPSKNPNQSSNRLPIVNHLLFMPIEIFKPSSNKIPVSINVLSKTRSVKSVFDTESIYSKEFWLQNNQKNEISCYS